MKTALMIAIAFGVAILLAVAIIPTPSIRNFGSMVLRHPAISAKAPAVYEQLAWEELIPKGWDPMAKFKERNLGTLLDSSAQALDMLKELREVLDNAPTIEALNGRKVRLPGYVVPLEVTAAGMREFLLVPYFGACIHTPPPPANQIIHVKSDKPVKGIASMEAVWVEGTLSTGQSKTDMGASGYALSLASVEAYVPPAR